MTYYICSWLVGLVVLALLLNRKFVGLIPTKKMCNASSTDFFLLYGYVSYSRTILNYPTRIVLPALPTLVLNLYNFLFLSPTNGWFFAPSQSWNLGRVKEQFRSDFSATTILGKKPNHYFSGVRLYPIGFGDCLIFRRVLMATMKRAKVL